MQTIIDSIINGQRRQALAQMEEFDVNFKELLSELEHNLGEGAAGREIAILADMKG